MPIMWKIYTQGTCLQTMTLHCVSLITIFAEALLLLRLDSNKCFSCAQLKKKYGALPTQKGLLERRLKGGDKKYFDSADWAKDKDKGATPGATAPADARSAQPRARAQTSVDNATLPPSPAHIPPQMPTSTPTPTPTPQS